MSEILTTPIPHNRQAEEALLGAILINPAVVHSARVVLKDGAEEFYIIRHQFIWIAITALLDTGIPVDAITLEDRLTRDGKLDEIGGPAYLTALLGASGSSLNSDAYARIIHLAYLRRRMLNAANDIATLAYQDEVDADDLISQAASAVSTVARISLQQRSVSVAEAVRAVDAELEARSRSEIPPGIPTGLIDLDKMLGGGANNSDLNLISARPGWGKTSLLVQIMLHAARYAVGTQAFRKRAMIFSLEMPRSQLILRMISTLSGIDFQTLRAGDLPEEKYAAYYSTLDYLSGLDIVIDDTPAITPVMLASKLEVANAESPVDIVFVDSLNLMRPGQRFARPDQEVDFCATELKILARKFDIPFWVAHQMNRGIEYRGKNSKPLLADLREGGEQPADGVFFIFHETDEDEKEFSRTSLICAKQRNGPTGEIPLFFRRQTTRFESAVAIRM